MAKQFYPIDDDLIERIKSVMNEENIRANVFADELGYAQSSMYQILKGNRPAPASLLEAISRVYSINLEWLRTGYGEMLVGDKDKKAETERTEIGDNCTLLLPTSAKGGTLADFAAMVQGYECERVISPIKGIDFAMTVTGDSMAPEYPNGSRVFIKKINERAFIDWGRVYVLDTCNGAVIKKVMPGSSSECVRCVSINKEYPDFEVQFGDMYGMYRVLLLLTEK